MLTVQTVRIHRPLPLATWAKWEVTNQRSKGTSVLKIWHFQRGEEKSQEFALKEDQAIHSGRPHPIFRKCLFHCQVCSNIPNRAETCDEGQHDQKSCLACILDALAPPVVVLGHYTSSCETPPPSCFDLVGERVHFRPGPDQSKRSYTESSLCHSFLFPLIINSLSKTNQPGFISPTCLYWINQASEFIDLDWKVSAVKGQGVVEAS